MASRQISRAGTAFLWRPSAFGNPSRSEGERTGELLLQASSARRRKRRRKCKRLRVLIHGARVRQSARDWWHCSGRIKRALRSLNTNGRLENLGEDNLEHLTFFSPLSLCWDLGKVIETWKWPYPCNYYLKYFHFSFYIADLVSFFKNLNVAVIYIYIF